eukprot:gene6376-7113_t
MSKTDDKEAPHSYATVSKEKFLDLALQNYCSIALVPSIISGKIESVKDSQDFTQCIVSATFSQRDIERKELRKFKKCYISKLDKCSGQWHQTNIPVLSDKHNQIIESCSPDSKMNCVIRKVHEKTEEIFYLEIWSENGLEKNFNLTAFKKHGDVYCDATFSSLEWSDDCRNILYIAESKQEDEHSVFSKDHCSANKRELDIKNEKKFIYEENWGEQKTTINHPTIVIFNMATIGMEIINEVPDYIAPGQCIWGPNNSIIFVGWWRIPYQLGLVYCENRRKSKPYDQKFRDEWLLDDNKKKMASENEDKWGFLQMVQEKGNISEETKRAELMITGFIIDHNIPFRVMNHLSEVLPRAFHDSAIAKNFVFKRTKATCLAYNILGEELKTAAVRDIVDTKHFSVIIEESTDRSTTKSLAPRESTNSKNVGHTTAQNSTIQRHKMALSGRLRVRNSRAMKEMVKRSESELFRMDPGNVALHVKLHQLYFGTNVIKLMLDPGFVSKPAAARQEPQVAVSGEIASIFPLLEKLPNSIQPEMHQELDVQWRKMSMESEILEKAVYYQVMKYLEINSLINKNLSGYRRFHSTTTALIKITDDILRNMERGFVTSLILTDLSKAFDTVGQTKLLVKLSKAEAAKNLGLVVDQNLKWDAHIKSMTKKCNEQLIQLTKIRKCMNPKTVENLVKVSYTSTLDCCDIVYGNACKRGLQKFKDLRTLLPELSQISEIQVSNSGCAVHSPRISPDKSKVIYLERDAGGPHRGCERLMVYSFETRSQPHLLYDIVDCVSEHKIGLFCYSLPQKCWLSNGKFVVMQTKFRTNQILVLVDVSTGTLTKITNEDGSWNILDTHEDLLLASFATPNLPPSLRLGRLNEKNGVSWSHFAQEPKMYATLVAGINWEKVVISVDSNRDEEVIECLLVTPEIQHFGAKHPIIIWPHGGPHTVMSADFLLYQAAFASLGFALLLVNYRGSLGFGEMPLRGLLGKIGVQDVGDVKKATDYILDSGRFDGDNVFIFGGSHGGFLSAHLIGQYPGSYKGCVLRNPVINLAAMVEVTDIPDWCYTEAGLEFSYDTIPTAESYAKMLECSPIFHVDKVRTPVLILVGGSDVRVPPSQGRSYYRALKSKKRSVEMMWYQEDCHPLNRVESEANAFVKFVAIFAFATCTGFRGNIELEQNCNNTLLHAAATFQYPFNAALDVIVRECPDTSFKIGDLKSFLIPVGYKSSAEYFVVIGVFCFLYCIGILAYYIMFEPDQSTSSTAPSPFSPPVIDFVISVVFVVFWFTSAIAFAVAVTGIKKATNIENIIGKIPYCNFVKTKRSCTPTVSGNYATLDISALLGFLNVFVWCGNLWFLYKETPWHAAKNRSAATVSGPSKEPSLGQPPAAAI